LLKEIAVLLKTGVGGDRNGGMGFGQVVTCVIFKYCDGDYDRVRAIGREPKDKAL
jgi:hypothetical protein